MNGNGMIVGRAVHHGPCGAIVSIALALGGCSLAPPSLTTQPSESAHRATRAAQEREQELAALRADMAATRVAAAKKEAELQELRTLVAQLRNENGEFRQAAIEAQRAGDAARTEVVALKAERDGLANRAEQQQADTAQLAALQTTVATLSHELDDLKQAMAAAMKAPAQVAAQSEKKSAEVKTKRQAAERREPTQPREAAPGFIPAMQVLRNDVGLPRSNRVTVQPGDTLWGLAKRYRTTVEALRAVNQLPGDQVVAGRELKLP